MNSPRGLALILGAMVFVCASGWGQESAQIIAAPAVIGSDVEAFRAALDMNGDGDKDALSIWFQGPTTARVSGWSNDGAGVFALGWSLTLPLSFSPPRVGEALPAEKLTFAGREAPTLRHSFFKRPKLSQDDTKEVR